MRKRVSIKMNTELINRLIYKKATPEDVDALVAVRLQVLRTVFKLNENADLTDVEKATYDYYKVALLDGSHTAYLVFDEDCVIGVGGICYFQVMPMPYDPSGKRAYIMNVYTDEKYRGNGIAGKVVNLLIEDSKSHGVTHMSLSSTEMGRPLYEKFGFVTENGAMIYRAPKS